MVAVRFSSLPQCALHSSLHKCIKPASFLGHPPYSRGGPQAPNIQVTSPTQKSMANPGFPLGCLFPKTHFFSLLAGLPISGASPHEIWNWSPYKEGKERPKKEADHSRWVGGRFDKKGNLHLRLVLCGHKISRSLHPPIRILKVYIKALTGFSHVFSTDGLNTTLPSQGCVLENDSSCGNMIPKS